MSQLDNALAAIARGFFVFPCVPRTKRPLIKRNLIEASNSEAQLHEWWKSWPRANPALALGLSGLTVVDVDGGLANADAARDWYRRNQFPPTFTVQSCREECFGFHAYFRGLSTSCDHPIDGTKGEIKSTGRYVMWAGAIHPNGKPYKILADREIAPVPDLVKQLSRRALPRPQGDSDEKVKVGSRHGFLVARARELVFTGLRGKGLVAALRYLYEDRCVRDEAGELGVERDSEDIASWAELHPPEYRLQTGDFIAWRHAEKDPLAAQAWAADLTPFENNSDRAFSYLIQKLREIGCGSEQAFRIIDASPLAEYMRKEFPVPDFLENVGGDE